MNSTMSPQFTASLQTNMNKKYCLAFRLPAKTDALLERPCAVTVTIFCDVSEGLICRAARFAACLPKWSRLTIVKWTLADRKRETYGLEK